MLLYVDYILFSAIHINYVTIVHFFKDRNIFTKPLTKWRSSYIIEKSSDATVAQLVEQRIRNAQVVRSSRTSSSKRKAARFLLCKG